MIDATEKDLMSAALMDYDLYTSNQKKVLDLLLAVSVEGVAHIGVPSIGKAISLAQNTTYIVLRSLENEGLIARERSKGQKSNAYKLNQAKLDQLVKIYNTKKFALNKK